MLQTPPQLSLFSRSDQQTLGFCYRSLQSPRPNYCFSLLVESQRIASTFISSIGTTEHHTVGLWNNSQLIISECNCTTRLPRVAKLVQIQFLLEVSRIHIHSSTEHAAVSPLIQAKSCRTSNCYFPEQRQKEQSFRIFLHQT